MSFDTTARQWVAPKAEKQDMPACLPLVSFLGDERAVMTDEELNAEAESMWMDMREDDEMVVDAPAIKIGMPYAAPYEGATFPVEIDGVLNFLSIPTDQIERFARTLLELLPEAIKLEKECDAEFAAFSAINKAKGV